MILFSAVRCIEPAERKRCNEKQQQNTTTNYKINVRRRYEEEVEKESVHLLLHSRAQHADAFGTSDLFGISRNRNTSGSRARKIERLQLCVLCCIIYFTDYRLCALFNLNSNNIQ